jgi:hypothetical protein
MKMQGLNEWVKEHFVPQDEKLIWKEGTKNQFNMIRRQIAGLLAQKKDHAYEEYEALVKVCSTHTSKSVKLPVYFIDWKRGLTFIFRDNYYNWNVTVLDNRSDESTPLTFPEYMQIDAMQGYCFVEGFPAEYVKGKYEDNPRAFTFACSDDYQLYAIFWHLVSQVEPKEEDVIKDD